MIEISNKRADAMKLGVRIINETQLREMFEKLIGLEGTLINITKTPQPCCVHARSDEWCQVCNDTKLIVQLYHNGETVYVKTCKCNLKLNTNAP